jgi:hypothetical protein
MFKAITETCVQTSLMKLGYRHNQEEHLPSHPPSSASSNNMVNFISWVFLMQGALFYVAYPQATSYLIYVYLVATFQYKTNQVFPFTYASAIALLVFTYWRFTRATSKITSFALALPFPFAGTSFFEQTYQTIGYFAFHFSANSVSILSLGVNLTAVLMIFSSIRYWRRSPELLIALFAFAVGFAAWALIGYPQIYDSSNTDLALLFNVPLKILSFVILGLLIANPKPSVPS